MAARRSAFRCLREAILKFAIAGQMFTGVLKGMSFVDVVSILFVVLTPLASFSTSIGFRISAQGRRRGLVLLPLIEVGVCGMMIVDFEPKGRCFGVGVSMTKMLISSLTIFPVWLTRRGIAWLIGFYRVIQLQFQFSFLVILCFSCQKNNQNSYRSK